MCQITVYLSFVVFIAVFNYMFYLHEKTKKDIFEALGGILYLLTIIGSISITLLLNYTNRIEIHMWPNDVFLSLLLLLLFALFARNEMITTIMGEGRDFEKSLSTFFGSIGIHFSSMLVSIGILFPLLNGKLNTPLAIFLSALSFPIYHFSQFYVFKKGITLKLQFQIFAFSLGYVLFYFITGSFILTFILQHIIASVTFINNRDYDFGKRDFAFYFGIVIVAVSLIAISLLGLS